jgi:hypothetical protein
VVSSGVTTTNPAKKLMVPFADSSNRALTIFPTPDNLVWLGDVPLARGVIAFAAESQTYQDST